MNPIIFVWEKNDNINRHFSDILFDFIIIIWVIGLRIRRKVHETLNTQESVIIAEMSKCKFDSAVRLWDSLKHAGTRHF